VAVTQGLVEQGEGVTQAVQYFEIACEGGREGGREGKMG